MSRICFIPVKCGASGMPCEDTMQILPPSLPGQLYKAPPRDSQIYPLQRGLKASVMIPGDPQPQGPAKHLEWRSPFDSRSRCCTCVCFVRELCPPLTPSTPQADHPPLFSLVKEPRGNHISRWVYLLSSSCATLITAPRKDQSSLN